MIYKLTGKLIEKSSTSVAIDVTGVAYEVIVSLATYSLLPAIGSSAEVFTHLIVREDGVYLYGFYSLDEKEIFLQLITVSGIGPKVAIKILGGVGVNNLKKAIANKDYDLLTTIPGVGKKSAERIIVELKDKFDKLIFVDNIPVGDARADVVGALVNLGYKMIDARKSVENLKSESGFENILRDALKALTGKS